MTRRHTTVCVAITSCACCGMMFLPGGTADLIGACTDLDTDQVEQEKAGLENHPWPQDVRDQGECKRWEC